MEKYHKIAMKEEIPEGTGKRIELEGKYIALFNVEGEFYAIDDTCSHEEASLSQGELEEYLVECPLHGSRFDVRSGEAKSLPALMPVSSYRVKTEGGSIFIVINSE